MAEALPTFRYHPDPVATGAVEASDGTCPCCGAARGYAYVGPVFAEDEVEGLCPWCIADGSAASRFDAEFTEVDGDVPDGVLVEVTTRTPGFTGWQQERWLVHCGDAAAYLGATGDDDLELRFRCLHCGAEPTYTDSN
jgi:uncharacterized protein CbrC (UPF0167 family)